jgi:hypothetical protein
MNFCRVKVPSAFAVIVSVDVVAAVAATTVPVVWALARASSMVSGPAGRTTLAASPPRVPDYP